MERGDFERRAELTIGRFVRAAVSVAAAVALAGGTLYLYRYGLATPDYGTFKGQPDSLRNIVPIVQNAFSLNATAVIQFAILLLIAIPIARTVAFLFSFLFQRDWLYGGITLAVFSMLLFSLLRGGT